MINPVKFCFMTGQMYFTHHIEWYQSLRVIGMYKNEKICLADFITHLQRNFLHIR
ncbi:hypothetical protein EHW99_3629 [Erwinia amylovora]|nr:hypothetical protein EHX00_3629 [Erwinia amylovora]QJQ60027.1 hypothetical protein EHW99_3629 [Erwinia amylovora]QJQ63726.1 hypothetical protein EHW98_3629 [Erwinia amylovora]QJQ67528.1 hypothetical protein EHW96_3629 [Erwinia amylovora]QJQ71227.1 hypothetical protein EGZ89_3629 [Erwinia amylovora]